MSSEKYHGKYDLAFFYQDDDDGSLMLLAIMLKHKNVTSAIGKMVHTAMAGNCIRDCGVCGACIKSRADLFGFAYMEGADDRAPEAGQAVVSPLCRKCCKGNRDVLQTRYMEIVKKDLFGGDAKFGFVP